MAVPNFGLHTDLNYRLLSFIDGGILSTMPLKGRHIDCLAEKLNWDMLSKQYLPGWVFVKYKKLINWRTFLNNKYKKDVSYLVKVEEYIYKNVDVFDRDRNKRMYYTEQFLSEFPSIIDWEWCGVHMHFDDKQLLRHWSKIPINTICRYQRLSFDVMTKKLTSINWNIVRKRKLSMDFIDMNPSYFDWELLTKFQQFDATFWDKYMLQCRHRKNLAMYQKLPGWFIHKHKGVLDIETLSKYQDFAIDFLKKHVTILHYPSLLSNIHYNKPGTIQIIKHNQRIYIIDKSTHNIDYGVIFCNIVTL